MKLRAVSLAPFATPLRRYWPVLVAAAVLVPHAALFDFVNDDAYISFRYARNLAEHGELTFNLGERVEGFTNFLWTVLLAVGLELGVSPVHSSRFLGVVFGVGTLAVAVRMSLRLDRERPSPWHLVAPLGLAVTSAFACWCTGGLETQLFTFLSFLGWERLLAELEDETRRPASAVFFALSALTRPEGALLFALAALFRRLVVWRRRGSPLPSAPELRAAAVFLAIFVPYFLWRWRYYGWLFPNTFYVKSSAGGGAVWGLGLFYLRRFAEDHALVFLAPLLLVGWRLATDPRRRRLFALATLVSVTFALYTAKVGGDFMGLYRFVLPILPLGAVAAQEALRSIGRRLQPIVGRPVLLLAGLLLAGGYVLGAARVSANALSFVGAENGVIDSPAYLKRYADERIPVGRWFGRHARPDDLMTVGGAGVIPYYAGIRAYDVFGLVDETIAHDPRMTVGVRPGHQKWGSEEYMLSRKPTLITHRYCLGGPCDAERWYRPPGYEWVRIPDVPFYYSFLKRVDRAFGPLPARAPRGAAQAP